MRYFSLVARWSLSALAGGLLLSSVLHAQDPALRGRAVLPEGDPVVGISVTLHRVGDTGGQEVGRATTDAEGRFEIPMPETAGDGIYFAATRYESSLYMGATFRSLAELSGEYVVLIGANPVGRGRAAAPPPPPDEGAVWPVAVLIGLFGVAAVGVPLLSRKRPGAERMLLVELAELEEELAGGALSAEARAANEARREELRTRLRGVRPHAAAHAAD